MDLQSTLIRAESLFRRFQRTVETIDRKDTFPAPKSQQQDSPSSPAPEASSSSGADTRSPPPAQGQRRQSQGQQGQQRNPGGANASPASKEKVISPELRGLLSRKVEKITKEEARKGSLKDTPQ